MALEKLKTDVLIEDKTFTNPKGEKIAYTDIRLALYGGEFRVSIKKEDKSLFDYLRKKNSKTV